MNDLKVFENKEFGSIRTVQIDNEPYFVGKDVADILGYANPRKAIIDHVDEEDKTDGVTIRDSIGREQNPVCINESGLYSLILSSKLPTAKKFKRWVTAEVLPAIRKTGGYVSNEEMFINTYLPYADEQTVLMFRSQLEIIKSLNAKIETDKPKVLFADAVDTSHTSILVGDLAKLISQNGVDIGQKRLFQWLRDNGYLMKVGESRNMPTQRAMEQGLFEVKERTISNPDGSIRITRTTKVTGKGQIYFINKLSGQVA